MCGVELPRQQRGRGRRYCSSRCRQTAYRQRKAAFALEPSYITERVPPVRTAGTDEQVVTAIGEGRMIAGAFLRLGRDAHPRLAWRCAKVGAALCDALDDYFPGT